jgi:predicted nucleotide-binding protein
MKESEKRQLLLRGLYELKDETYMYPLTPILESNGIQPSYDEVHRIAKRLDEAGLAEIMYSSPDLLGRINSRGIEEIEEQLEEEAARSMSQLDDSVVHIAKLCTEILALTTNEGSRLLKLLPIYGKQVSQLDAGDFDSAHRNEFLLAQQEASELAEKKMVHNSESGFRPIRENITVVQRLLPYYRTAIKSPVTNSPMTPSNNKVFVVHGRNEEWQAKVSNFLRKAKLEPIILHERPSKGRTVIEKLEANSDVAFAVVLLTADDEGSEKSGTAKPRARQNVILELGYFFAKVGRHNVCALYEDGVETPSDFTGIVYVSLNSGNWQATLGKELIEAGFEIDLNKAL